MGWKLLDTGVRRAAANMELDAALLSDLKEERDAILHLYDWEQDAATFGHFIDPENFLKMSGIKKCHLDLARRPTGGGIIFHNCDLAFSILVPAACPWFSQNPLDNYAFVNNRVVWAIEMMIGAPAELLGTEPLPSIPIVAAFVWPNRRSMMWFYKGKKLAVLRNEKRATAFCTRALYRSVSLPNHTSKKFYWVAPK